MAIQKLCYRTLGVWTPTGLTSRNPTGLRCRFLARRLAPLWQQADTESPFCRRGGGGFKGQKGLPLVARRVRGRLGRAQAPAFRLTPLQPTLLPCPTQHAVSFSPLPAFVCSWVMERVGVSEAQVVGALLCSPI